MDMEAPGTDEEPSTQILVKSVDMSPEGPKAASATEEDSISESVWRECGDGGEGWTPRTLAKCFGYKHVKKLSLQNAGEEEYRLQNFALQQCYLFLYFSPI